MILDHDLVIRRALVSIPGTDGGSDDYLVETRGTVRPDNCPPVAQTARYQRTIKPKGLPERVDHSCTVWFISASGPLSAEEYAERTKIEPTIDYRTIDLRSR
jgi:hypothetical protein